MHFRSIRQSWTGLSYQKLSGPTVETLKKSYSIGSNGFLAGNSHWRIGIMLGRKPRGGEILRYLKDAGRPYDL
jgi:hypothetical protein